MITIINYGLGNIQAFYEIYKRLNIPVNVVETPGQLKNIQRIILPGVGAFDWAMGRLNSSGMREVLDELVLGEKCPVLGVCVGMQMMAHSSDEGKLPGLGWINAHVKRFDDSRFTQKTHLPHMGWNNVEPVINDSLFHEINSPRFYFLHSYYFLPKKQENVLATTDYNGTFVSSVRANNVFGTQFHPEKSHQWGVQLLKNFAEREI
ncbi:MAG: imidazole glycerol phosphate synthase subunit HisH [Gammaproteobacteria bacterium]|nr:MAG: imidazole glycerol phosphate synthase subunit HisH [Gammaproteobacteria bacterium]